MPRIRAQRLPSPACGGSQRRTEGAILRAEIAERAVDKEDLNPAGQQGQRAAAHCLGVVGMGADHNQSLYVVVSIPWLSICGLSVLIAGAASRRQG